MDTLSKCYQQYDDLKSQLKRATTNTERKILEEKIEVILNRIITIESLSSKLVSGC